MTDFNMNIDEMSNLPIEQPLNNESKLEIMEDDSSVCLNSHQFMNEVIFQHQTKLQLVHVEIPLSPPELISRIYKIVLYNAEPDVENKNSVYQFYVASKFEEKI